MTFRKLPFSPKRWVFAPHGCIHPFFVAKRTKGGTLLMVLLVAVGIAYLVPAMRGKVFTTFGSTTSGTETIGQGDSTFMVAKSAASDVNKCTPQQALTEQKCGNLTFVIIDAAGMPFITRNISTAWEAGKPGVLTRDRAAETGNRRKVCGANFPRPNGGQCAEFPFASTRQGGEGVQEQEVPPRESQCLSGTLSKRYAAAGIGNGDDLLVIIAHPGKIAPKAYQGTDVAQDKTCA
jgi:hypothetical protein